MSADTRLEELGVSGLGEVDEPAFSGLAERHRRELHVHCYRMLGSFEDAEDTVQETFLRAWRRRETFEGRSTSRAWLYRISTNACLDLLAKRRPEPATGGEVLWLQPYPDRLLDELPADDADEPETVAVARETIELAYLVAVQHLAPRPRAVLILRDVLGWPAKDVAELLGDSVNSVNSALPRAAAGARAPAADDRRPARHRRGDHRDRHVPRRPVPAARAAGAPAGGRHGVVPVCTRALCGGARVSVVAAQWCDAFGVITPRARTVSQHTPYTSYRMMEKRHEQHE